jgi:hypothetical protein
MTLIFVQVAVIFRFVARCLDLDGGVEEITQICDKMAFSGLILPSSTTAPLNK